VLETEINLVLTLAVVVILAIAGWVLTGNLIVALIGAGIGFIISFAFDV
jgi:hypothetical protein